MVILLRCDTYFTLCLCLRHFASVLFVSSLSASYAPMWSHMGISSLSFWDGNSACSFTLCSFPALIISVRSLEILVLAFGLEYHDCRKMLVLDGPSIFGLFGSLLLMSSSAM